MKDHDTKAGFNLRFFTSAEVAEILKMHPQVIARKLQSGDMEGYKIGKDWRVSEDQLMRFLERHSNKNARAEEGADAPEVPGAPRPPRVPKVIDAFFEDGKLKSIPAQRSKRVEILKHLVAKLDPKHVYTEEEINRFLASYHSDVCTLRREFIMNKLMVRKDGKYKVVTWNR